jgi:flagellum-specific peptidoglycan hydrolase FlgJ
MAKDPEEQVYVLRSGRAAHRFRRYAGEEESFQAYGRLLSRSKYYARARQAAADAALNAFLDAMAPVYCPGDPEYALKIRQIIQMLKS